MKFIFHFVLLFSTLTSFCQNYSQNQLDSIEKVLLEKERSNKELINKPFPVFSYVSKGETIDNNYIKGKTVFINFWFEACPPCVAEFEALNEMNKKLKRKKKVEFITFTFETEEAIEKIRLKHNIQYKVFSIPKSECYRLNNNNGFPTSMIIDAAGLIQYRTTGGHIEKEKAREFIMNYVYPKIVKML